MGRRSFFDIGHPSERKGTRGSMISGMILLAILVLFTILSLLPSREGESSQVPTQVDSTRVTIPTND